MRIGIQTWGSRGDINPFLALAAGLQGAGHEVHLCATDVLDQDYSGIARESGFRLTKVATPVLPPEEMDRIGLQCLNAPNPLEQAKIIINDLFEPKVPEMFEASLELCSTSDLVIRHFFLHPMQTAARKLDVPEITVSLVHNTIPSPAICPAGFPNLGQWSNRLAWWVVRSMLNRNLLPAVNAIRKRENLAPLEDLLRDAWVGRDLNLVAVSPTICERPYDWEDRHRVVGFFNLPDSEAGALPAELDEFLEAGDRPAFITLGSLTPRQMEHLLPLVRVFHEAIQLAGIRAIVQVPEDALNHLPANDKIHHVSFLDHRLVFPRCALVVHHGGAGTTQSTLQAGVPSIVIPHVSDQFFWAAELRRLVVAPKPLPIKKLTAPRLAAHIQAVLSKPEMRSTAARLGQRMRNEDGVSEAVHLIGQVTESGTTTEARRRGG